MLFLSFKIKNILHDMKKFWIYFTIITYSSFLIKFQQDLPLIPYPQKSGNKSGYF